MPAIFVGHGSPMNAIEDNEFSRAWAQVGQSLPRPQAIVSISAHWETVGSRITGMSEPATLYDFQGFPKVLYDKKYPAPGDPQLARSIKKAIGDPVFHIDANWGLDHGTWSVLCHMYPHADIPVVQLSLDFDQPPMYHYELGKKLKYLRSQGVLIIGSGNMVHNLRAMEWKDHAFDWGLDFDAKLAALITAGDHKALVDYSSIGEHSSLAIPTNEHYLPLLYVLATKEKTDGIDFFCEKVTLSSISMRSLILKNMAHRTLLHQRAQNRQPGICRHPVAGLVPQTPSPKNYRRRPAT